MNIHPFKGKLTDWNRFKNIFEEYKIQDELLSNSDKKAYLLNSIEGEALLFIGNFRGTFEDIWKVLKKQYTDKWKTFKTMVAEIQENLHFKNPNYGKMLCQMESLKNICQSLDISVNREQELGLILLFEQRLDRGVRIEWERSVKPDRLPTLDEFIGIIGKFKDIQNGKAGQLDIMKTTRYSRDNLRKTAMRDIKHPQQRGPSQYIKESSSFRKVINKIEKISGNEGRYPEED